MKHRGTVTSSSFGKAWTHRCHVASRSSGMESSHPKFISQSCCMSCFTGKAWGCTKPNGSNIWLAMDRIPRCVAGFCFNLTFISKLSLPAFKKTPSVLLTGSRSNSRLTIVGDWSLPQISLSRGLQLLIYFDKWKPPLFSRKSSSLRDGWPRQRHLPISNSRRHKRSLRQFPGLSV